MAKQRMDRPLQPSTKSDDEGSRHDKRVKLKQLNLSSTTKDGDGSSKDSSLKRHTAFIKRMRQSVAADNREQLLKDMESLSLEKYIDEIVSAVIEGISRCKTDRDVWAAVEVISSLYQRFPATFTPALLTMLSPALSPPTRGSLSALPPEQREKEEIIRIVRQRPVLRVCSELALVGIIREGHGRSGGEWIMKALKDLLYNDPSLSSLPLLTTFLKSYSGPFLGTNLGLSRQSGMDVEDKVSAGESDDLVEQDVRGRFKRMCEGYYDRVCKKLVIEHKRLQEIDRRNHEAYIKSGEIFEDRQQAYEKMTKGYEKLLTSCQSLSELLCLPMPSLPVTSQKSDTILIGSTTAVSYENETTIAGGKWEDEEERRFYEEIADLKDFVPGCVMKVGEVTDEQSDSKQKDCLVQEPLEPEEDFDTLDQDPPQGSVNEPNPPEDDIPTPMAGTPTSTSPQWTAQGPSQLLSNLLIQLLTATSRTLIDQIAIDFAFLNSKAARKRLVKFLAQVPKNRTDLIPYYSRLVATLNRYMPDIGAQLVSILDEEFRYLQRKKNVVRELAEVRLKNIFYFSALTKFQVVPTHLILHVFKVCLDDFSGVNVENLAMLLEGCGRFLLRSKETSERFSAMLELMKRKQSMQHFDHRQILLIENAYYQCNPPDRIPREEKHRTTMELFIRHLMYDVLAKKTIDKVLKLIRKIDWRNQDVLSILHKVFTKPWKITYGNIGLLATLTYDLQRYHPDFVISIVDQVLENVRRGLEQNIYTTNQRRQANIKYLGELYIYRLLSSGIIFDTLWSLVTFGHGDGRPIPKQLVPLDMPDDFFRIRLVCALLDTCGMCFDRGAQKKKLDNFLIFFQYYIHCKDPLPMDVDFMVSDSFEAVRPKFAMVKTVEEAAITLDAMFSSALQHTGIDLSADDSGDDTMEELDISKDEDEGEGEESVDNDSPVDREPSPEQEVILSTSNSLEYLGPSEEAEAEFAKELAKMMTDHSSDSKKVDKKTALAMWDATVMPANIRKKKGEDYNGDGVPSEISGHNTMAFTMLTKRGNKQQIRQLAVPATSTLAVHTRSAQLQDKVEQEHLKRLVLDYEQREEAEEMRAWEARSRTVTKVRHVG